MVLGKDKGLDKVMAMVMDINRPVSPGEAHCPRASKPRDGVE